MRGRWRCLNIAGMSLMQSLRLRGSESRQRPLTLASLDLSPRAGRGAKQTRSRGAFLFAPEFCSPRHRQKRVIARSQRVRPEVAGPMTGSATKQSRTERRLDCFATRRFARNDERKKGGGTPIDAVYQPPRLRAARALQSALACRRSTAALAGGTLVPRAQLQAMFPGTWQGRSILKASPNRGRKTLRSSTGVTRADLSQSRECTSRTGRSAGQMMPEAAREAGRILPPAGAALAPSSGVPSAEGVLR